MFKLRKFARERACLKGDYWQNPIEWQNHLFEEETRLRNKNEITASLIDAIKAMKAQYLQMYKDVRKSVYGEGPYILSPPYKQNPIVTGYEEWREMSKQEKRDHLKAFFNFYPSKADHNTCEIKTGVPLFS